MVIEKAKDDIVYFAEQYWGMTLQEWQRVALQRFQSGEILYLGGYRTGKNIVKESIRKWSVLKHDGSTE